MNNVWNIKPQGSTLERAIINTLNFLTDIVFETIVKPNGAKLDENIAKTNSIDNQVSADNETILDLQYENDLLQDQVEEDNEAILDLDYRLSIIEEANYYFERYKKLILDKTANGGLTEDFITQTTERLDYYLSKKKITQEQYDELITLMNPNES